MYVPASSNPSNFVDFDGINVGKYTSQSHGSVMGMDFSWKKKKRRNAVRSFGNEDGLSRQDLHCFLSMK